MATESQFVVFRSKFRSHLYGPAAAECSKFKPVIELGVKTALTIICTVYCVTLKVIIKHSDSFNLTQRELLPSDVQNISFSNVYADICIAKAYLI